MPHVRRRKHTRTTAARNAVVIYDQETPNPNKMYTKGFLTDFGSTCHVKWHTKSLLKSYVGKGVISKMVSNMFVSILHWLYLNNYPILKGGVLRLRVQQSKGINKLTNG